MNKIFILITVLVSSLTYAQQAIPGVPINSSADKSIGDLTSTLEKMKLHEGKNQVYSAPDHAYTVFAIVDKELNISSMEVQNAQHISLPVKYKNITEAAAKKTSKPKTKRVCREFCFPVPGDVGASVCATYCANINT